MNEPEQPKAPNYIDAAEVARMLEFDTPAQFTTRYTRLVLRGFPQPVPWTITRRKWRRADVQAWIDGTADFSPRESSGENPDAARRVVMLRQARQV